MKVVFHIKFLRNFDRRIRTNKRLHRKFLNRYDMFKDNRKNSLLKDHQLRGSKKDKRSFSITGDCRVVYKEYKNYFILLDISSNNQVYYN